MSVPEADEVVKTVVFVGLVTLWLGTFLFGWPSVSRFVPLPELVALGLWWGLLFVAFYLDRESERSPIRSLLGRFE